jgi:hypothetical protein
MGIGSKGGVCGEVDPRKGAGSIRGEHHSGSVGEKTRACVKAEVEPLSIRSTSTAECATLVVHMASAMAAWAAAS